MAAIVAKARVILEKAGNVLSDSECDVILAKAADCTEQPEDGDKFIMKIELPTGETIVVSGEIAEFTDSFGFFNTKKAQGGW